MGTNIDYSTVSHETIYQHITGGPGSIDLTEASRGWQSVAAKLQQLHGDVEQAVRGIGAAQQGAAADAATHATMALVPWLENSVAVANGIADRIAQQASSFGHTRDNMPPPVKVPDVSFTQNPGTWMADHAVEWLPGIQTGHEQAQVEAQQAQQRAQELMSSYQGSTNDNLMIPQQFAQAPTVVADVSDPSLGGSGIGGPSGGGGGFGASHSGVAHPALAHTTGAAPTHAGAQPGHAGPVAPAGTTPQLGSGAHQPPPAATAPQLAGGYHPGGDGGSLTGSGQARPAAAASYGASPILTTPSTSTTDGHLSRGGSRIAGGGGGGAVSRSGGFGPRPTSTFGEGHAQTGSSWHVGTEHASPGGSTRSGSGFSGAPLGATGSAGRGENNEHRRPSYLIEQDTNAIVGELPRVAPPVIGAD